MIVESKRCRATVDLSLRSPLRRPIFPTYYCAQSLRSLASESDTDAASEGSSPRSRGHEGE